MRLWLPSCRAGMKLTQPQALDLWRQVLARSLAANGAERNAQVETRIKARAISLCSRFPIYGA